MPGAGNRFQTDLPFERNVDKAQRAPVSSLSLTDGPFCILVSYVCIHMCKKYSFHQGSDLECFLLALLLQKY